MSVAGLKDAERISSSLDAQYKKTLLEQKRYIKSQIEKIQTLLGDRQALAIWRKTQASDDRLASLYTQLDEVEKLYLEAGDTYGARVFRERMERELKQKLTNLKANQKEIELQLQKFKVQAEQNTLQKLTEVKREASLREMYQQSRLAGGFLSNFGKAYIPDIVTLQTKAAGSKTLGEYMSKLYDTYEKGLKDVLVNGIVRGDSYQTMINNLTRQTNITARKAQLLVRTEANSIFNESVKTVIKDNPLVKGYRFRAVLDRRTSKICQQHDGDYIPKDQIQPGINYPPLHPNCRSTVTTVLASEDERVDTMQRYTKNGSNQWEKVPVGMKYQEYKDKYGFVNSKNPTAYNAATRSIHDATLARITPTMYKGYVKPSASSTARIDDMIRAYINNDEDYLNAVKQNTGYNQTAKALFRQAQAESGFDGLPLQLDGKSFTQQVRNNEYRVMYRQFKTQDDVDQFLSGTQPYGTKGTNYGAGTYAFATPPEGTEYGTYTKTLALKSKPEKILTFTDTGYDSQGAIASAMTPDSRINRVLETVSPEKRKDLLSLLAVQYGYDAMLVTHQTGKQYYVILNRTAVLVKG